MTNPQHIEGLTRIDGDFHYATWYDDGDYSDGTFEIHRKSDGKEIAKWFHADDGPEPDARAALEAFDDTARHFTAAAVREIDDAAKSIGLFAVHHSAGGHGEYGCELTDWNHEYTIAGGSGLTEALFSSTRDQLGGAG